MIYIFPSLRRVLCRTLCAAAAVVFCGTQVFAAVLTGEAYSAAEAAYGAISRGDLAEAEKQARAALALQPDSSDAVRLIVDVLNRRDNAAEALRVADAAIANGVTDADLRAARAYLLMAAGRHDEAVADFTAALADTALPPDRQRTLRLSLSDAAATAQKHDLVLETLAPLAAAQSYDVQARVGFAAFTLERFEKASQSFAIAAAHAATPEEWATAVKGQAQAEAALGRRATAVGLVTTLNAHASACDLDLAYTLLRVGADAEALALFEGRCEDEMTAITHLDAAYAARRLGLNAEAADHFKAALDIDRTVSPPAFDAVTEFGIKRSVDSLERQFGISAGGFYRGDRSAAGGGNVGQGLVEAYWQPPAIGNRDGKLLQVYGRVGVNAITPASTVQTNSTQGAVGLRYKPLADLNLVLAGERLFAIGDNATRDWLLRAGYSVGFNTDLQPARASYFAGQAYAEAAYFVDQDRFIGAVEARYGLERRLGPSPNLLGAVYVNGAYNYDSAEIHKAVGAVGVGAGVRYWFRESAYRAPASVIQVDVMYRFKIGPSDRAAGLILQTTLAF